jgi:hypothetical protein
MEGFMRVPANYYVYAIVVDGVVHYVGKGKGRRMHYHRWFANDAIERQAAGLRPRKRMSFFYKKLIDAIVDGLLVEEIVIARGLTEDEALEREIFEVGSRDHLWNMSPGGDGKTSEQGRADWARDDGTRRATMSAKTKARWDDPVKRAKMVAALKVGIAKTDQTAKGAAISKSHDNDRVRKAKSDACRARAKRVILKAIVADPGLTNKEIERRCPGSVVKVELCRLRKLGLIERRDVKSKYGFKGTWFPTNVVEIAS